MRALLILLAAFLSAVLAQVEEPRFGRGPWVFAAHGAQSTPVASVSYANGLSSRVRLRLDDGGDALLRVEPNPCGRREKCDAMDCGCHGTDRYRFLVADDTGRERARADVWAAYGSFDVMAVDLVGGSGDELILIRALGRSAPPSGHEMKILQIEGDRLIDLTTPHQVAGNLSGTPMVCGYWRSRVSVDLSATKPRVLTITNEVVVPAGCTLDEPRRAALLQRERRVLTLADISRQ